MLCLVMTLGIYVLATWGPSRWFCHQSRQGLFWICILHGCLLLNGFVQSPVQFGFAPALSVTAWMMSLVYWIESHAYPQLKTQPKVLFMGLGAVVLAQLFPGHAMHHNTASTQQWQAFLHGLLGMIAYGLVTSAAMHAWWTQRTESIVRNSRTIGTQQMPLLALEKLTFKLSTLAWFLLTGAWVLGVAWAQHWVWTHKNVLSLASWAVLTTLLIGRHRFGWRGKSARWMLYTCCALLLLAYAGSHFVLEVLLHRTP
jgi:ABC-type uncharacterized transport system permease subunit